MKEKKLTKAQIEKALKNYDKELDGMSGINADLIKLPPKDDDRWWEDDDDEKLDMNNFSPIRYIRVWWTVKEELDETELKIFLLKQMTKDDEEYKEKLGILGLEDRFKEIKMKIKTKYHGPRC